ncbi:hypothetical protein D1007_23350 [Hordeum vulgare]|nr:hypothetical protein D1007_23350 [Hordeum vulgare]
MKDKKRDQFEIAVAFQIAPAASARLDRCLPRKPPHPRPPPHPSSLHHRPDPPPFLTTPPPLSDVALVTQVSHTTPRYHPSPLTSSRLPRRSRKPLFLDHHDAIDGKASSSLS